MSSNAVKWLMAALSLEGLLVPVPRHSGLTRIKTIINSYCPGEAIATSRRLRSAGVPAPGGRTTTKARGSVDKRQEQRTRTFKGGKICFNYGRLGIDCTIKNLSPAGAALLIERTAGMPEEFNLIINPDKIVRACKVVWKTETQIGVVSVARAVISMSANIDLFLGHYVNSPAGYHPIVDNIIIVATNVTIPSHGACHRSSLW